MKKSMIIIICFISPILFSGCILESEHDIEIDGILISIEIGTIDLIPFNLPDDFNASNINISLYFGNTIAMCSVGLLDDGNNYIIEKNSFPLDIEEIENSVTYNFIISITISSNGNKSMNHRIEGYYVVNEPDELIITINESENYKFIDIIKEGNNRSSIEFSNISIIFDVGVIIE